MDKLAFHWGFRFTYLFSYKNVQKEHEIINLKYKKVTQKSKMKQRAFIIAADSGTVLLNSQNISKARKYK